MMQKIIIQLAAAGLLCLMMAACQGQAPQENPAVGEPYPELVEQETAAASRPPNSFVKGSGYEGVILTQERAAAVGENLFGGEIQGYWVPTQADIQSLEEKLLPFIRDNQAVFGGAAPGADRLSRYKRQYVGIIQDGQRVIFVNLLCQAPSEDWQREFLLVMDGGACFFQVKYRLDTGSFFDLKVNGEA